MNMPRFKYPSILLGLGTLVAGVGIVAAVETGWAASLDGKQAPEKSVAQLEQKVKQLETRVTQLQKQCTDLEIRLKAIQAMPSPLPQPVPPGSKPFKFNGSTWFYVPCEATNPSPGP